MKTNSPIKYKHFANSKGFTLLEITIVIAIIAAVLAIAAIPAYNYVTLRSRITSAKGTAHQLATQIQTLISQNGSSVLPITETIGTGAVPASELGTNTTAPTASAAGTLNGILLNAGLLQQPILVTMGSSNYQPANYPGVAVTWSSTTQQFTATATPTQDYSAVTRAECAFVDTTATPGVPGTAGLNWKLDGTNSLQAGARVAYLIIKGVLANESYALAQDVDGASMVGASALVAQTAGQVAYAAPSGGVTDVYYYLFSQ